MIIIIYSIHIALAYDTTLYTVHRPIAIVPHRSSQSNIPTTFIHTLRACWEDSYSDQYVFGFWGEMKIAGEPTPMERTYKLHSYYPRRDLPVGPRAAKQKC